MDIYTSAQGGPNEMYLNSVTDAMQFEKASIVQQWPWQSYGIITTDFNNDGLVKMPNPSHKLSPQHLPPDSVVLH